MCTNYTSITEMPGEEISSEQLKMICCRYYSAAKFVPGKKVLEAGCGPGLGLGYLMKKGAERVIGGDCTESSIRHAYDVYRHDNSIELLSFDAHKLPFRDKSFDIVLLFEVIFYLQRPKLFLEESRRVLRAGGILMLCLPNRQAPGFRESPLSTKYYNAAELYKFLACYYTNVEVYGAFPVQGSLAIKKIASAIRFITAKLFDLTVAGRRLKERLKKPLLGRNLILRSEIDDSMCSEDPLVPIPSGYSDFRNKILYAIAYNS